jgi:hypothetical protein
MIYPRLDDFEVFVETRFYQDDICLYAGKPGRNGEGSVALEPAQLVLKHFVPDGTVAVVREPWLVLSTRFARTLCGALWRHNARPSQLTDDSDRVQILKDQIAQLKEQLAVKDKQLENAHVLLREANSLVGQRLEH